MKRVVIAGTGASGIPYLVSVLNYLSKMQEVETHLIMTDSALEVVKRETNLTQDFFASKAFRYYHESEISAPIASGSFKTDGMLIIPCSTKTLSAVANGYSENLVSRAAEVVLKERRRLVLVIRETPLSLIDIENMRKVALAGAVVMPASPAFYSKPKSVEDIVNFVAGRALSLLGIENDLYKEWNG
ncbi:MAG: UbiX family flavin prenyltransferase [Thermoprotei archaeon]|jgi:4-hydroxy-3-polyprenylbenzoate decarboxylase